MGNWAIVIRGVGSHHNKAYDADANRMAAEFVVKLRDAGHHVEAASFTHGSEDVITNGSEYLAADDRRRAEKG